jgi:capsular exopolysaccharide synthesis family protein
VEAGLESLEIDVVDPALLPANPVLKRKTTLVLTYFVIGLAVGIMVSFLLESLDTGMRNVAEVEGILELPSLAIIPRFRRSPEVAGQSVAVRNIISLSQPKSQFAEAFRSLRTSLLLSSAGHPPKQILLTSATPAEGKTTASINLATVLAQGSARVLLIDADLRRPTVHERFGLSARVGLSSVLTGSAGIESALQRIKEVPNLDILVSGPMPPFPTELLSSEAMRQLLQSAYDTYTHIVIDSPPVLSVTDAVLLAREADAVVLVIRQGKSSKHIVRRARDLLLRSGAPVTGILLNAVDVSSPDYYGYYGYSGYSSAGADADSWEGRTDTSGEGTSGEVK